MNYLSKTLSITSLTLLGVTMALPMEEPEEQDSPRPRSRQNSRQTQTLNNNNGEDDEVLEIQLTPNDLFDLDFELFLKIEPKNLKDASEEEYACYRVFRAFRNLEFYQSLSSPMIGLIEEGANLAKLIPGKTFDINNFKRFLAFVNQLRSIDNSELKEGIQRATALYHIELLNTKEEICNLLSSVLKSDSSTINAIVDECVEYKALNSKLKDKDLIRIVKEAEDIANKARDAVLNYLSQCTQATQWIESEQHKFSTLQSPNLLDFPTIESLNKGISLDLEKIAPIYYELQRYIFDHWHSLSIHRPKKQIIDGKEIITCLPFIFVELKELSTLDIELMPDSLINTFKKENFCLFHALRTLHRVQKIYESFEQPSKILAAILYQSQNSILQQRMNAFISEGKTIRASSKSLSLIGEIVELTLKDINDRSDSYALRFQNAKNKELLEAFIAFERLATSVCTEVQKSIKDISVFFDELNSSIGSDAQNEKKSFRSTFEHVTNIHGQLDSCLQKILQFIQETEASIERIYPGETDTALTQEDKTEEKKEI